MVGRTIVELFEELFWGFNMNQQMAVGKIIESQTNLDLFICVHSDLESRYALERVSFGHLSSC